MRMAKEASFISVPRQGPRAGPDTGLASYTSHLDTSSSQGSDEHTHGALFPAMTLNFATVTDERTPVLPPKDRQDMF